MEKRPKRRAAAITNYSESSSEPPQNPKKPKSSASSTSSNASSRVAGSRSVRVASSSSTSSSVTTTLVNESSTSSMSSAANDENQIVEIPPTVSTTTTTTTTTTTKIEATEAAESSRDLVVVGKIEEKKASKQRTTRGRKIKSAAVATEAVEETAAMHENQNILNEAQPEPVKIIKSESVVDQVVVEEEDDDEDMNDWTGEITNRHIGFVQKSRLTVRVDQNTKSPEDLFLKNYGKIKTQKFNPDLFLVGTHTFELKRLDNERLCSYEHVERVRSSRVRALNVMKSEPEPVSFAYRKAYALCGGSRYHSSSHSSSHSRQTNTSMYYLQVETSTAFYLFEIKTTECALSSKLVEYLHSKIVQLDFKSIFIAQLRLEVDIKLEDRLDNSSLIDQEPSAPNFSRLNINPNDVFFLLEQFALIKRTDTGEIKSGVDDTDDYNDEDNDDEYATPHQHSFNPAAAIDKGKETLFDLIYEKRGELKRADIANEEVQRLSGLKPRMRPYQIDAVKWMLSRETSGSNEKLQQPEMHPFYLKVTNSIEQTIFVHKFFAIFTTSMPMKELTMPGGILADEMGLGKTIEILALIGINRRQNVIFSSQVSQQNDPLDDGGSQQTISSLRSSVNTAGKKPKTFSCLCGRRPEKFGQGEEDVHTEEEFEEEEEENDDPKDNDIKIEFDDDDEEYDVDEDDDEYHSYRGSKRRKGRRRVSGTTAAGAKKRQKTKTRRRKRNDMDRWGSTNELNVVVGARAISGSSVDYNKAYACVLCGVYSHPYCLNYTGSRGHFKCLQCYTKHPIESGCTLIVTPASICSQWRDEIDKHMKSSHLRVYIYRGLALDQFNPLELAKLDVCITTYEVLAAELDHVFAFENMRELRRPKLYMNVPSPLQCIKWWRVCLDEAQMVHSTQTKCAAMASRLAAVNRWCVTGTPIGRSLKDLHGLFVFIREDPYQHIRWFKNELENFRQGSKETLTKAVANVLWRTSKKRVEDQINIPKQTERVIWVEFTPFESHLYERVLEMFRTKRANATLRPPRRHNHQNELDDVQELNDDQHGVEEYFREFDEEMRLDELDRGTIESILEPVLDLRLVCNHPQLVLRKRTFNVANHAAANNARKHRLLTMEASLEILMKKTQAECDTHFRTCVMHMNGMAGLSILMEDERAALDMYEKILTIAEIEFNSSVNLDRVQKVHTLHNYIDLLTRKQDDDANQAIVDKIERLRADMHECERAYLVNFEERKTKSAMKFIEKKDYVKREIKKKKDDYLTAILTVLKNLENSEKRTEFWENKMSAEFMQTHTGLSGDDEEIPSTASSSRSLLAPKSTYMVFGKVVTSFVDLEYVLVSEYTTLMDSRVQLLDELQDIDRKEQDNERERPAMVQRAACCHLRNELTGQKSQASARASCELCTSDLAFKKYANSLFTNSDDALKPVPEAEGSDNEAEQKNETEREEALRNMVTLQTNKARSDFEKLVKILISFCKQTKVESEIADDLRDFNDLYTSLKDEFKWARGYWLDVSQLIQALDELEMCKTRMELDTSAFTPQQPKDVPRAANLVFKAELKPQFAAHQSKLSAEKLVLGQRLRQLFFLKNTQKSNKLAEGEENTEPCPICQLNLGFQWFILKCGHMYCRECYVHMSENNNNNELGIFHPPELRKGEYVRCALCREVCERAQNFLVSTKKKQPTATASADTSSKLSAQTDATAYNYQQDFDLSGIKMKGNCNSAKVEGVVKCLLKILRSDHLSKCIVFSEHVTMLEMIVDLLQANSIEHRIARDNKSLQRFIDDFRHDREINVLLMPYSLGANGLNIIEATHVLLVEPTLNRGQEFQAIGRVHRIGQTRPTFVYRFMIKNSIEQHLYDLLKSNSSHTDMNAKSASGSVGGGSISASMPNTSKKLSEMEQEAAEPSEQTVALSVKDVKNLFLKL